MINSPLRYPGGKSKAVKFLAQFFPEFKELREPMFGGGSITFYWVQKKPKAKYTANDLNYDLYCFWKTLKEEPIRLIEEIKQIWLKYHKELKNGKLLYNFLIERRKNNTLNCFQKAVDFFILNRITFSGTVDSGGYSEQAFQKRFTFSSIERLKKAYEVIKHVDIHYGDYSFWLKKEGDDVVIFLDPPYYTTQKSRLYGKRGNLHTNFDHERLFNLIKTCPHKVLITYDNHEYIRELYKDFYIIEWNLKYGMSSFKGRSLKPGKELLIANFPLKRKSSL